jgi:hypothetical protein
MCIEISRIELLKKFQCRDIFASSNEKSMKLNYIAFVTKSLKSEINAFKNYLRLGEMQL